MPFHIKCIRCVFPLAGVLAFAACQQPICASKRAAQEAERVRRAAERSNRDDKSKPVALSDPGLMIWDRPVKASGPDTRTPPALPASGVITALRMPLRPTSDVSCRPLLEPVVILSPEQLRGPLHRPHGPPSSPDAHSA